MPDNNPEKDNWHFLFLLHFWILWDERSEQTKKEKSMLRRRFFALKFGTFQAFYWHVWTCRALVLVLLNFEMLWHSTISTELHLLASFLSIFLLIAVIHVEEDLYQLWELFIAALCQPHKLSTCDCLFLMNNTRNLTGNIPCHLPIYHH